tara:strand:+ start:186 stop:1448 length:1263 start_codon:yes stop_codon:yes gene_type:complete
MNIKELYKIYKKHPIICTDSRKIIEKGIFFALKGKNFDGNKFAQSAISQGCSYAIVDDKQFIDNKNTRIILVQDVLETLQLLAMQHRQNINIPVIAITGSNGKTTSKELIHTVLASEYSCCATIGNLNNHIGVPLSLLKIKDSDKLAIIEMGANSIGEISKLCDIAQPNYGVITNIGKAHLEGFVNLEGVVRAKSELYKYIKKNNGSIFINNDDELLLKKSDGIKKYTYGITGDYTGKISKTTPFINVLYADKEISTNLIGEYQYQNIMLAICIGDFFNIRIDNIKKAIESYTPKNNRSQIINTEKNTIILDAYNANPTSMNAMLSSFAKQDYNNKLCIIGDMLEMGESSLKEHQEIINLITRLKLDTYTIGKEFSKINKHSFVDVEEFITFLKNNPFKNKTILLKGSRSISLEKMVEFL